MARLYEFANDHGDTSAAQIARRMNVSIQAVVNWEKRGISREGALLAQLAYGCDANWLLGHVDTLASRDMRPDANTLRTALQITEKVLHAKRVTMTPEARAEVSLAIYDMIQEGQAIEATESMVARMLQAIGGVTTRTD